MYAAQLVRDAAGHIVSTRAPVLLSAPGSANTCGFFHPQTWTTDLRYDVLFASTITPPALDQPAGFRVGERRYQWMFPEEMEIVKGTLASVNNRTVDVRTRTSTVTRRSMSQKRVHHQSQRTGSTWRTPRRSNLALIRPPPPAVVKREGSRPSSPRRTRL